MAPQQFMAPMPSPVSLTSFYEMVNMKTLASGLLLAIALVLSLVGLARSGSKGMAVAGLVLGLIAVGLPAKGISTAMHSPIHDVSTDTGNPPQFVDVMPLRAAAKAAGEERQGCVGATEFIEELRQRHHAVKVPRKVIVLGVPPIVPADADDAGGTGRTA